MGLLFTAGGVAACLVGNTGGSVASILWTASRLSLFGLMLLQLAGLGLCFFGILACAALRLRDARVLLPHDRASQRRLFVGRMGADVESASAALAPIGAFTSLRLY